MSHANDGYDAAREVESLSRSVAEHPDDADAWYNLGLAHKYLHDWRASADANRRALEIRSEPGDPAWWNLGIAATALRDWRLARTAWRSFGIDHDELADGDGPIELDWGPTPVRLIMTSGELREVVWGRRVCPARIKIQNIPLPESGHRWGDVVLHDGAPNGERVVDGRAYPVFDELERWGPSEIATLECMVRCASDDDVDALIDAFRVERFDAEDWSTNVRTLCKACSEGVPEAVHDHRFPAGEEEHVVGIAAPPVLAARAAIVARRLAAHA